MLNFLCSIVLLSGADSTHIHINMPYRDIKPAAIIEEVVLERCPNEPLEIREVVCNNVVPKDNYTRVCYVETNIGYFFIMRDMLDGVNIIYNRWD